MTKGQKCGIMVTDLQEVTMEKRERSRVTFDVTPEIKRKLKLKAVQEGKTISDVMRELLQRWLEEEKEKPPPK